MGAGVSQALRVAKVLLVEDEPAVARSIARLASLAEGVHVEVTIAGSCTEARARLLEAVGGVAMIADVLLPDGNGLDVIADLRVVAPALPVLVLTGVCDLGVATRAKSLGARFLVKPALTEEITGFLEHAAGAGRSFSGTLLWAAHSFAERHGLTERDEEVLYAIAIDDRREVAKLEVNMSLSTLRTHLGVILERTGADDVRHLGAMVRAAAREHERRSGD